ncbi:MAG: DUF3458 domain-containing protein, partial [Proteobacteria bacterium]|nr:DUF3458 domain-containing protein [Pseudomonadota bacterium]
RGYQFPEDNGPMAHPVRPDSYIKMDNFYTMTVYEKGAELVRMIHQLTGEEKFRQGIDLYFKNYDGMAVTIEDFVAMMQEASGIDLDQFKLWYFQSGTPTVTMTRSYDSTKQLLQLTFSQETPPDRNQKIKQPLHIPVRIGIINEHGQDITPDGQELIELKKAKDIFTFNHIPPKSLPSIFRQFSAPVKIRTDFSDKELSFLMARDTDSFNRWDAAQTLFIREIEKLVNAIQNGTRLDISSDLISAFDQALADTGADRAFLAKTLALPSETEIKDHFECIDVDAIHQARCVLEATLAGHLEQAFIKTVERCSTSDPLSISGSAMADRSLKNLALSYLGSLKKQASTQLILDHFTSAENMTDELAAFKILSEISPEIKETAVRDFYVKWEHDKLVLDKWFAVQAGSSLEDTPEQMGKLIDHPDFSMTNPNKVRALIYMFAMQNPVNFHSEDGKGYKFIADQIILLDTINHQIAARLSSCFNHWKKYDSARKALMKKELERILSVQALSKNVYEIVSRALG